LVTAGRHQGRPGQGVRQPLEGPEISVEGPGRVLLEDRLGLTERPPLAVVGVLLRGELAD